MHWFDSIDLLLDSSTDECQLRVVMNCPSDEFSVVEAYLSTFSSARSISCRIDADGPAPTDGLPDFVLKTTPELVIPLAATSPKREAFIVSCCATTALCMDT